MNILKTMSRSELDGLLGECNFTEDESEVFDLMSKGFTATQMAFELNTSEATINRRKVAIMDKVNKVKQTGVPIWEKRCLTIEEASEYSNIGICKIRELCANQLNRITFKVGNKTLIKKKEFDDFIAKTDRI